MEVDLIIKNVKVFNVYFKKFIKADVAILKGKFLYIGNDYDKELKPREILDGKGQYLIPGLIDIHMHIESSMTTPLNFAQTVVHHGVTTIVAEPHEIANVFGIEGIESMICVECDPILDIFYAIPSSVPSTSSCLETTGGSIDVEDVTKLLKMDRICCLGEVMNFKELTSDNNSLINQIIKSIKITNPYFPIEGHCPRIKNLDLAKYIYQGVDADHTQQTVDSLSEKISNGMFIEMQEKSMSKENIQYLIENNLYEHFCFVTDDTMADKLPFSHLNGLVKKAILLGMTPEMAVYTSTYTPAFRMGLRDRGSIAPGKLADFVLIDDIDTFNISSVYKKGKNVNTININNNKNPHIFPKHFYKSVRMLPVNPSDFNVPTPKSYGEIECRIMEVESTSTFTKESSGKLNIENSYLQWENSPYCLITVFDRYGKTKNKSYGLVNGDIIKKGAVCTTYAHDHHNLMVMGKCSTDMTIAANWVIENQGGYCVVFNGKIIASLSLPVGGILSEEPIEILSKNLQDVRYALKQLGYKHNNEIMSFSTLSLPVSPALKITDKGLIRVKTQEIVSLFL